ncbi:MAG: riboflavin synthase [Phycisphaeraceae bacterium]|nr:riboflavin synthase [Phycisphaeraceae bacterium]
MTCHPTTAGRRLTVDPVDWNHTPRRDDSISVAGCCLTVVRDPGPDRLFEFDIIPETLTRTTLGRLTPGSQVNLEHSLRADSLLGGHLVQGHIDGVGQVTVVARDEPDGGWRLRIGMPEAVSPYVAPKGSITVDGVSLTVALVGPGRHETDGAPSWFEVALIPTTLQRTTLSALKPGDLVNLEADMIAKTVVWHLQRFGRN